MVNKAIGLTEFGFADTATAPTIAVVIVGRNSGQFVGQAFDSIIGQTDSPDEVIYYDDGSADDSLAIAKSFESKIPQLRVIDGGQHLGISTARNSANAIVKSEYIAVLDADDLLLPDSIKQYREAFAETDSADLIYADTLVFREGSDGEGWRMRYPAFEDEKSAFWRMMAWPVLPFKHSSIAYRKNSVLEIGGYREDIPFKVDYDLLLRFIKSSRFAIGKLEGVTSRHRAHSSQVSKDRIRGILLYWKVIDSHVSNQWQSCFYKGLRALGEVLKFVVGR